jgi:CHAT domain-containing protein
MIMKRQKGFIWLICLGLISSCAVPKHPNETDTPPVEVEMDNNGQVLPSNPPQAPSQTTEAVTSALEPSTWTPNDEEFVPSYSPECPSPAALSSVAPDSPSVVTADSVELTRRSAAQQEQLKLAAHSHHQAVQYLQQGQFQKALPLAETAYRLKNNALGEKHPDSLTSLINLALIHQQKGRYSEALPLFKKGHRLYKTVLGKQHPITVMIRNNWQRVKQQTQSFAQTDKPLVKAAFQAVKATTRSAAPLPKLVKTAYQDKPLMLASSQRVSTRLSASQIEQLELAESYNTQAYQYLQQGLFQQALPLAEKAYQIRRKRLGEKHPNTLISLNNLAMTYQGLGRLSEALPLSEKVYRLLKEMLGEKHPYTLASRNNLAQIYQDLGRLSEALPLLEKGYRLRKEVLGEKHPDTFLSINNLAKIYQYLGRLSEALPLLEKNYRLSKEVLGEKHPDTLKSLNNLALIYQDLGRLSEALPLFEKGYRFRKELLGEQHPDTLNSLGNLAMIYQDLGRLSETLPLLEKVYRLRKEMLGEKHPSTLTSLNNLGFIYNALGRLDDALFWYEKGYRLRKELLGEKHPDTLQSLNNLAGIYNTVGSLSDALPLLEKGYRFSKEVLGEQHPNTLTSLNNFAMIYKDLGRLSEALPLLEKVYRLRKEMLGEKHPSTLTSLNNLVQIYQELGRVSEALPLSEKVYFLFKEVLGEKHPSTLTSLNNLAHIYQELGLVSKVLPLSEKVYRLYKEALGEKHPDTLISLNNLAFAYAKTSKTKKAIKHFEKLVAGVEQLRSSGNFSAENRQALFKQWVHGYFALSELYIGQSKNEDAFRLAEMSKARTLLESLAAKLAAQTSGLSDAELGQLQQYDERLAFLNNKIAKALADNRVEQRIALETEKNQWVNKRHQFHQQLMKKYPKYAQLSDVQILTAEQGARLLPDNAVLISYLVHENFVLAFTLQSNGQLTAHDLGKIPNLETDIKDYHYRLMKGSRGQPIRPQAKQKRTDKLSRQLGKQLLEPLKPIINNKTHWIISPSGPLALIPYETLRLEGEQPVIAQHQISYVQSLSMLALLQQRNQVYQRLKKRGSLLAMGAPIYQKISANPLAQTPSTADFNIARTLVRSSHDPQRYIRAFEQLNKTWKNLPGTLTELNHLGNLFKKQKPCIYKKAQATEANLQRLNKQGILAKYRYLVFSAHGYLSPQVPALSSIVLGLLNNPTGIDGYVTAGEWPGYDLKSDLMVLSACETGLGEAVSGEGVMGLPYAFYVAGNKNTLLTLWSISDEITAEFITRFFAKLKAGQGQIQALTATKREFMKRGGNYSKPMYWAAFVLYGV